jgi:hypothetical protein
VRESCVLCCHRGTPLTLGIEVLHDCIGDVVAAAVNGEVGHQACLASDFPEGPFDGIGAAHPVPIALGDGVAGEEGFPLASRAGHGDRSDGAHARTHGRKVVSAASGAVRSVDAEGEAIEEDEVAARVTSVRSCVRLAMGVSPPLLVAASFGSGICPHRWVPSGGDPMQVHTLP